jgi:BlaI family penicillinase repressor
VILSNQYTVCWDRGLCQFTRNVRKHFIKGCFAPKKILQKSLLFSCILYNCKVFFSKLKLKEIAMAKKNRELTEAEWTIIQAVWENQPCAAPTVQEILQKQKGWHYSTVKTLMDRMAAKGLLTTEKIRNLTLYRAAITRKQAQKGEVMRAVKRAFDGALTPMMQFLLESNQLSQKQLSELEAMIKSKKAKVKRQK